MASDNDCALLTSSNSISENGEDRHSLSPDELATLDHYYSDRVLALSNRESLMALGCNPIEASEILSLLKSNPDIWSDYSNGHLVGSEDLEADEMGLSSEPADDALVEFTEATQSCLNRFQTANDLFVYDNAAWVHGFDQNAFERHQQRSAKVRRYHGIEDIVLDKAGRVRSPRRSRRSTT